LTLIEARLGSKHNPSTRLAKIIVGASRQTDLTATPQDYHGWPTSFPIPFWVLRIGFLRVARYPPAASQIATAKTSVNAGRHRRTHRQEPEHKGGVGGALQGRALV
jgi:hypothetical protein